MSVSPGVRLGPYEILAQVGAGGMGEVYRAKDTRLDRTVAIKILPAHLSSNPDFKQRFEREARTISSLSHPYICALYDIGHQDGIDYLVMEFLEGETVAQRLSRAPLPIEQVLRFGMQIADALDKAHRQGIIHRDLKPGNIMITKSGVKLLDFGLAKLQAPVGPQFLSGISVLPTEQRDLTAEGTIIGTIQYMSPEQLEGREADARTDIFALGLVLYEMATGRKAFTGKSQASLISAILKDEPASISTIQPMAPPAFDRVVKTCLAKDPEDRWQTAHDVMLELKWIAEGGSQPIISAPAVTRRRIREYLAWTLATIFLIASIVLAILHLRQPVEHKQLMRLSLLPPEKTILLFSKISPDGLKIALVGVDPSGKQSLWVRSIDSLTAQALPETEGAQFPFWSPDSRKVGFFADGKLKKIEVSGGRPQVLYDAPVASGGTWSQDGVILFAGYQDGPKASIYRISSSGGAASPVTRVDWPREEAHRWPCFLPDGKHFLFLGDAYRTENHHLRIGSLNSSDAPTLLTPLISNIEYAGGNVMFVRRGVLVAQRFDPNKLLFSGEPFPVTEEVAQTLGNHKFDFSGSENGILAYRRSNPNSDITWFDRTGKRLGSIGEPGRFVHVDLSPDGKHAVAERLDPDGRNGDIWMYDFARNITTRLTFDPNSDLSPIWSRDGTRIVFASNRDVAGSYMDLYQKNLTSGGREQPLLKSEAAKLPTSWSPDGKFIVLTCYYPNPSGDIFLLQLSDHKMIPLVQTQFNEFSGQISPDGRWLAYVSDESGKPEIYAQAFPSPGGNIQISANGGAQPRWRQDGKELFYIGGDGKVWAVGIKSGRTLEPSLPKPLFETHLRDFGDRYDYAVSADGQRFLVNTIVESQEAPAVHLIFNWQNLQRQ
jgi:serine/threonine protein kinase